MTKENAVGLMRYLFSRPHNDLWIKVISAVWNEFSESESLQIILSRWQEEKTDETLYKLRSRLSKFTIGTLVFYARLFGYQGNEESYYQNTNNYTNNYTRHKCKPRVSFSEYKKENCYHNPNDIFHSNMPTLNHPVD